MRSPILLLAMLAALPLIPSAALAQSPLTTVFSTPGGSIGGTNAYFDLEVTAPAITITDLDLSLSGTGGIEIYTRTGTRVGFQGNPAGWTLAASGSVTNATPGVGTTVNFTPFTLTAGVHGIAIRAVSANPNSVTLSYRLTNGALTSTVAVRNEVTLTAGEATTQPFIGPAYGPWVVNTSIRYLLGDLVRLPAHQSVYNGFSRGFNFTAATDFVLRQLALPPEAKQPGDTGSFLVRQNGAVVYRSFGNAGAVDPFLGIRAGDVVDVIGNWSPATPGSSTAHNSYAASLAPYAAMIQGVAHTLYRTGYQWDIGDPNWTPTSGAYLTPNSGLIGRILMSTEPPIGASNSTLGQGCGQQYASFYELLTQASFDLANSTISMNRTSNGGFEVNRIGQLLPVGSVSTPVTLALGDDDEVYVPFTTGSFPGWSGVNVCSNGFISSATGNGTGFTPTVGGLLNAPQTAFWAWLDYNPAAPGSGQIKIEESPAVTLITWDGVYTYGDPTPNTLQFQLYSSGDVKIAFGNMSTQSSRSHLVGYSPGGASADPGAFDISSLGSFGTFYTQYPEAPALSLTATSRPVLGSSWNLQLTNIPGATRFGIDIFGLSDPGILDLGYLGMPGCMLRAAPQALHFWSYSGYTHNYSLVIPSGTLLNLSLYTTSAAFSDQPMNPTGVVFSNGIHGQIGNS